MLPTPPARAYVVIVNWNGWRDTVECLASVLRSDAADFRVVVCDNGSTDGSVARLVEWATAAGRELVRAVVTRGSADGAAYGARRLMREPAPFDAGGDRPAITVIETGANLGFGAACNIGIDFALRDPACRHVWLLNNDTVVEPGALSALVRRLDARPDAGQCGSRVLRFQEPDRVEALGGEHYSWWSGATRPVMGGAPASVRADVAAVERQLSYVLGASLCATRQFVERVGPMEESYFLYFEEIDWAMRGREHFALAYADDSVVYHKHGQSTGSARGVARNPLAEYLVPRNRLRFTLRFAPALLPVVWLRLVAMALRHLAAARWRGAGLVLRAMLAPSTYRRAAPAAKRAELARYAETHAARRRGGRARRRRSGSVGV